MIEWVDYKLIRKEEKGKITVEVVMIKEEKHEKKQKKDFN
jgi:hypothetical protein